MQFQTTELDQIIHFDFDESVFDLVVISMAKTAILFILISELEEYTTRIALYSANNNVTTSTTTTTSSTSQDREVLVNSDNDELRDEIEAGINNSIGDSSMVSPSPNCSVNVDFYKILKRMLHFGVLLVTAMVAVYVTVKFAYVLDLVLKSRETQKAQPMTDFFFTILAVEFGFVVLELATSTLTWVFMRRLGAFVSSKFAFFLGLTSLKIVHRSIFIIVGINIRY